MHSTFVQWSEWLIVSLVFSAIGLALAKSPLLTLAPLVVLGAAVLVAWAAILVPPVLVAGGVAARWGRV